MSYTKPLFSADLRRLIAKGKIDHARIADWAYATHLTHIRDIDPDVDRWLIELGAMSLGNEFELTLEDLQDMIVLADS